jgi:hypothetical protein
MRKSVGQRIPEKEIANFKFVERMETQDEEKKIWGEVIYEKNNLSAGTGVKHGNLYRMW